MAALPDPCGLELVDLHHLEPAALSELLEEEIGAWAKRLRWDFRPSADLVQRYVGMRSLDGLALMMGHELLGYSYWVSEGRKALIGDLYVRERWRSGELENLLLGGVLRRLAEMPDFTGPNATVSGFRGAWVRRVEGQLMQIGIRGGQVLPRGPRGRVFPRVFMLVDLEDDRWRREPARLPALDLSRWGMRWVDETAELIASVYEGHIDSEINDQYRSVDGARRFMQNIVQFPGCGNFQQEASWIAMDEAGQAQGVVLSTRVSAETGHVAQVCVARAYQGSGAGWELMRRALSGLAAAGAREASLTVTVANERAVKLYERMGFREIHRFEAFVWEQER